MSFDQCQFSHARPASKKQIPACINRRRRFRPLTSRLALLVGLAFISAPPAAESAKPNVVFFIADDLGWGDVGFHGAAIRTPNLDRLTQEGVELEHFYVFPVCSPTRAALYTGRSPQRMGITAPLSTTSAGPPLTEHLLPESFRAAGYQTGLVGKWHLGGGSPERLPHRRGFDTFYGLTGGGVDYFTHGGWRDNRPDWWRNDEPLQETGYSTDLIADEAVRVVEKRDPQRPLFLCVAFNAPHEPLQAPPAAVAKYTGETRAATYAAMVEIMDAGIGRVLAALDHAGLRTNSIVLFLSDNGAAGNGPGSSRPWRDAKATVFEGGIRVPAILRWPGQLPAGIKSSQTMTAMDVFPTVAAASGVTPKNTLPFDGQNLWPALLAGKPMAHQPFLIGAMNGLAVREDNWKLVRTRGNSLLFDVAADPSETTDLAQKQPEILARLVARADAFTRELPPAIAAGPRRGGGAGRGPARGPIRSSVVRALDLNGDGELTADEIGRAPQSLRKLDNNRDGRLSRDEWTPPSLQSTNRANP